MGIGEGLGAVEPWEWMGFSCIKSSVPRVSGPSTHVLMPPYIGALGEVARHNTLSRLTHSHDLIVYRESVELYDQV